MVELENQGGNMDAMDIYNKIKQPPPEALKTIQGGRLSGFTDIKPQWRIEIMTRTFGLCGIGWKYTVDRQWTEPGVDGEVFAFVNLSLFIKDGEKWSDPIPSTGGSSLIAKERNGLHGSDEAYKMATTDALGVAMSRIGVAADIYMGRWDGSKYLDSPEVDDMQDVRDARGEYSKSIDPGTPAKKGDGIASKMLALKTRLMGCMASDMFSPDDRKNAQAEYHPGGRNLTSSESDLKYLSDLVGKWETLRDFRHEKAMAEMDSVAEEGFDAAMGKD
jgi:hypothetical protein